MAQSVTAALQAAIRDTNGDLDAVLAHPEVRPYASSARRIIERGVARANRESGLGLLWKPYTIAARARGFFDVQPKPVAQHG